jgi:hypothetical protein
MMAQERLECRPARFDRQASQIVAVKLHQIESVQHSHVTGTSTAQRLKVGEPVGTDHHCLAIEREALGPETRCAIDDRR